MALVLFRKSSLERHIKKNDILLKQKIFTLLFDATDFQLSIAMASFYLLSIPKKPIFERRNELLSLHCHNVWLIDLP